MFQRLSKHLTPSTFIAIIALVFALTGGAFAATGSGGSSHGTLTASAAKAKPKTKAGARGPAGPKGATGATGATGPAGATGPGGAQGPQGPAGTPGAPGNNGENGKEGTPGTNGINGTNGTTGYVKELPKGATETGTFSFSTTKSGQETNVFSGVPISFSIPLEKALEAGAVFYVTTEQQEEIVPPPAGCVGNVTAPTAAEGDLCVYQGGTVLPGGEINVQGIVPPSEGYTGIGALHGAGTSGAILAVVYSGPEAPENHPVGAFLSGSWAVTGN